MWTQVGCLALFALLAGILLILLPDGLRGARLTAGLAALGLAGLTVGVWFTLRADSVRLTPNEIETRSLIGVRSRRITDIVGARSGEDGVLLIGRDGVRPLHLPRYAGRDEVLLAWVNGLPNLDYEEAVALEAALERDLRLGSSPSQRQSALIRLRKLAWGLTWLSVVVMLWALVFPIPYDVALLALAGLFALALALAFWKCGLFTLVPVERIPVSANLFMLVMGPASVLGLRAFLDIHLLDWVQPLAIAVPVALIVGGLVWKADANLRSHAMLLFFAPILFTGSWGGLVLANARLDPGPAMLVPVRVAETAYGDRPTVTIVLPLEQGGRRKTIKAPLAVVRAADADQPLCALVHPGRFGWRHLRAVRCRFQ